MSADGGVQEELAKILSRNTDLVRRCEFAEQTVEDLEAKLAQAAAAKDVVEHNLADVTVEVRLCTIADDRIEAFVLTCSLDMRWQCSRCNWTRKKQRESE